jgi:putative SOS response-associated peptidase YedK
MCGRFVGNFTTQALLDEILGAVPGVQVEIEPDVPREVHNFNTAPTQVVPIVIALNGGLVMRPACWGLLPVWSKDASAAAKMINARSETITEKPSFRNLVKSHRAMIPMTGFYEWDRSDPKMKRPYFVPRADGMTMWAAGLWTNSPLLDGATTFTMITRQSYDDLSMIHDRSPVQLTLADCVDWATAEVAPLELLHLSSQPRLAPYEVDKKVNSVRNNGPELLSAVQPDEPDTLF